MQYEHNTDLQLPLAHEPKKVSNKNFRKYDDALAVIVSSSLVWLAFTKGRHLYNVQPV